MSELAQRDGQRVHLGVLVAREQREGLAVLAREHDRSVSAEVRQAVSAYLERERQAGDPRETA